MDENQIVIGLDLSKSHLRVAGLVNKITGRYIVIQGSKDAKVDSDRTPGRGELVESYRDAREIVKSSMGGADIQATVVVVPNATPSRNRDAIAFLDNNNRDGTVNVVEVISEYTAVAAAYAGKLKPNKNKTLAIISTTGDILDVCVVSVKPKNLFNEVYEYNLEAQKTLTERIDFEKLEQERKQAEWEGKAVGAMPVVGGLFKAIGDRLDEASDALKNTLTSSELSKTPPVDAVVFVGNVSTPHLLQQAAKERYPDVKVWDDIDPDEVAAYGGAVLAFNKTSTNT